MRCGTRLQHVEATLNAPDVDVSVTTIFCSEIGPTSCPGSLLQWTVHRLDGTSFSWGALNWVRQVTFPSASAFGVVDLWAAPDIDEVKLCINAISPSIPSFCPLTPPMAFFVLPDGKPLLGFSTRSTSE